MRRVLVACGTAFAVSLISGSAFAAKPAPPPPPPPPACSVVTFDVPTVSCLGFFSGNLIADSGPKLADALGYVDDLDPGAVSLLSKINLGSNPIDFNTPLYGLTVIGIHFGGGDTGYNGTAFWLLDLPKTINTVSYTSSVQTGISNAGLYRTGTEIPTQQGAVPEPSTWAMMLMGFGAVGFGMRRRKTHKTHKQRLRVAYS